MRNTEGDRWEPVTDLSENVNNDRSAISCGVPRRSGGGGGGGEPRGESHVHQGEQRGARNDPVGSAGEVETDAWVGRP